MQMRMYPEGIEEREPVHRESHLSVMGVRVGCVEHANFLHPRLSRGEEADQQHEKRDTKTKNVRWCYQTKYAVQTHWRKIIPARRCPRGPRYRSLLKQAPRSGVSG